MTVKENKTMKSLRFALSVVLASLCTVAFAQSDAQKVLRQVKNPRGFLGRPRDNPPAEG